MSERRQARVLALQALSQLEVVGPDFLSDLDAFLRDESPPNEVVVYARKIVNDVRTNGETIDAAIQGCSPDWQLARMAAVDRNLLRLSTAELLHHPEVPPKAVINEAVEIAKEFGSAESPAFVNGVLDAVRKAANISMAETSAKPSEA